MKAIYAGSFDPPTMGHYDILHRAAQMFEQVYMVYAVNPEKKTRIPLEERMADSLQYVRTMNLKNIAVISIPYEIGHLAKAVGAKTLVRGLRDKADVEPELQLANLNREYFSLETTLLPADPTYTHLSSTHVMSLARSPMQADQDLIEKHIFSIQLRRRVRHARTL